MGDEPRASEPEDDRAPATDPFLPVIPADVLAEDIDPPAAAIPDPPVAAAQPAPDSREPAEAAANTYPPDAPKPSPPPEPTPAAPARPQGRAAQAWRYQEPDARPQGWPRWALIAASVAAVAVLVAILTWLTGKPNSPTPAATAPATPSPTTTTSPTKPPGLTPQVAQSRLRAAQPAGYPPGACTPAPEPLDAGVLAELRCAPNIDPDGPVRSTYQFLADKPALQRGFDQVVERLDVVVCPGDIASPGPWRRSGTPERPMGTLVCGFDAGDPVLAWSNDDKQIIGEVRAEPGDEGLAQLYRWWASHS